jgi:hypothetical protein
VLLLSIAAAAAQAQGSLSADPSSPLAGETLSLTGRGLRLLLLRGANAGRGAAVAAPTRRPTPLEECPTLAEVPGMATGDHEVMLCVPTCDDPWGGTGSGTLVATAATGS